jgi:hypothetical protein
MKSKKIILALVLVINSVPTGILVLEYFNQTKINRNIESWVKYLEQEKVIIDGVENDLRYRNYPQQYEDIGIEFRGKEAEALFHNRIDLLCQYALEAEIKDTSTPIKYETMMKMALLKLGYKRHQIYPMKTEKKKDLLNLHRNKFLYSLHNYYTKDYDYKKVAEKYFRAGGDYEDFYESYEAYLLSGDKNAKFYPVYSSDNMRLLNDYRPLPIEGPPLWLE